MAIDLYKHQQRYENWKADVMKNGEAELLKHNSDILLRYVFDMEQGLNTALGTIKGGRSYPQLNKLRQRLAQMFRMLEKKKIKDMTNIKQEELTSLFIDLRQGKIKTEQGEKYKSISDFAKVFKAYWHWWMKVNRKQNKVVLDITEDLDSSADEKPKWVYLDDKQVNKLINKSRPYYKAILSFLYDSGFRVSETFSLEAQDITEENGAVYVSLKDENSKTFGRKIKLLLSGKLILDYIQENKLKPSDKLFNNHPSVVNRYLRELAFEIFGNDNSKAGEKYSNLSMYDFRHNSVCYWLPRYKTQSNLMYRFGWKSEKYIHYYSEFMGLKDTIKNEDLYTDISKTELEKEIDKLKQEVSRLTKRDEFYGSFVGGKEWEKIGDGKKLFIPKYREK